MSNISNIIVKLLGLVPLSQTILEILKYTHTHINKLYMFKLTGYNIINVMKFLRYYTTSIFFCDNELLF